MIVVKDGWKVGLNAEDLTAISSIKMFIGLMD